MVLAGHISLFSTDCLIIKAKEKLLVRNKAHLRTAVASAIAHVRDGKITRKDEG